ncbi:MAG: CRISPR-associated helicase Cas3' [Desulforegulaceae bacterium]|nr:CRISPR-associated helicase Cas3' [Desulforegulaceae bacterium]
MSSTFFEPVNFEDLIDKEELDPQKIIVNCGNYLAHIPKENKPENNELLSEHMERTKNTFLKLVKSHGLDKVVDKHIGSLISRESIVNKQDFYGFVKLLFFEAVYFHDLGKINENFQIEKMKNTVGFEKANNSLGSTHSILSVFLFYSYMLEKVKKLKTDDEMGLAFVFLLIFTMPVRKHHSPSLANPFHYFEIQDYEEKTNFFSNVNLDKIQPYLEKLRLEFDHFFHKDIFYETRLSVCYKGPFIDSYLSGVNSFSLFSLIKLNSSLLTISDYIATSEYDLDTEIDLSGVINDELKENVYKKFYSTKIYNKAIDYSKSERDKEIEKLLNSDLNKLRLDMIGKVRNCLKLNADKNLFFLEAPTGGGKTNMSFMAVAELLKERKELNKVFYVFPFTTLATQTSLSLKETFDLRESDYIELHSKAGMKKDSEENSSDGNYGENKLNYIDYQFVNYPFTLLTHIKFFDIVKSHKKNDNYLYHKLANSIVIIDELQAYSPSHWDKICFFMKNLSDLFNTVFIVMSATLPKINELKISESADFTEFVNLNKNKEEFFQNPNFAKRVEFDLSLLKKEKNTLPEIKERLFEESEKYFDEHGRCWSIVEFIFKNSASEFYDFIKEEAEKKKYTLKMLSGTILEPVRRQIIKDFKSNAENKDDKSKIILISTQVVEAGVDLDFDLGFKDSSIIDSDEQLAGRINRNALKSGCKVFLFNYNDEFRIYGSDYRYKMQKQNFDPEEYKKILKTKDFDRFYKHTFNYINNLNKSESRYGFNDYKDLVRNLAYSGVHEDFKLIDKDTISVFVDVKFDLQKYPIKNTLGLDKDNILKGADVFQKYCDIIENKDSDFFEKKISIVELQSLMSNFVFSMFYSYKNYKKLIAWGEEKYGFWHLSNLENSSGKYIYTLGGGLNEKEMDDFQFI